MNYYLVSLLIDFTPVKKEKRDEWVFFNIISVVTNILKIDIESFK